MSNFFEKFTVRWSDIDANRHLANSAYMNYTSQTRMSYIATHNFTMKDFITYKIGPVVLHERFSYFKEIYHEDTVYVGFQLKGMSEDGNLFNIEHRIYKQDGIHCATSDMFGVLIDMNTRKRVVAPDKWIASLKESLTNDTYYNILTEEDIKKLPFLPQNIDPKEMLIK